jgi:apolipoprotein N-acyltransferase
LENTSVKNIALTILAFAVSAVLLTVVQPPFSVWILAWVALVPFILICRPNAKVLPLIIGAYLVSAVYWLGNLYWMAPVTISGWIAFCLYTALLWPGLAFALRYCRIKKLPLFLTVPVLFVGAERLQGLFLGGFAWRLLAHSQYQNIALIQIADIFGAAGVSFIVAMVNGLIAELIIGFRQENVPKKAAFTKTLCVVLAVVLSLAYGQWRIKQTDDFCRAGPLIAALQSNVPQSVKESAQCSDMIFEELLEKSEAAASAGARLIVWPETMVQVTLSKELLKLLYTSHPYRVLDERLKEHAGTGSYLLIGAYGGEPEVREDLTIDLVKKYNSAFLYAPDGSCARQQYNKIHLVPFGEVVPFKKSWPWMHKFLMKFTPYDYDYTLDYGSEFTVFEMSDSGGPNDRPYRFGVMICYEDAVAYIARKFTIDGNSAKRVDWLVNISNDGWFVRSNGEKVTPSTELTQHTAVCVFRAVENRVAIVRSVNTGISCLIDSLGRLRDGFIQGTLPIEAMKRDAVAGWFTDAVPIDKRITFFSKFGQGLDFSCAFFLLLFIISACLEAKAKRKKPTGVKNERQGNFES